MKLGFRIGSAWIPKPSFFPLHCTPDQKTEGQEKKPELTQQGSWEGMGSGRKGWNNGNRKESHQLTTFSFTPNISPIFHYRKLASQLEPPSVSWRASKRTHPREGGSSVVHLPELQSLGVQERWAFWVIWIIPPQSFSFPLSFHMHQTCTEV